jgi:hypothetical protein
MAIGGQAMLSSIRLALLIGLVLSTGCASRIHKAAANGDADEVRRLVREKPSRLDDPHDGMTPLHRAVSRHRVQATAALIELGADVDAVETHDGMTALDLAKEGFNCCDPTWYAEKLRQLEKTKLSSERKMMYRWMLEDLYGPQAKPEWEAIVALLKTAQLTVIGPDGKRYPVITRLAPVIGSAPWSKAQRVTISAGPTGPMYTVRSGDKVIVRNATIETLQAHHPQFYEQFKHRVAADREVMAEHSAARDFTLTPQPGDFDALKRRGDTQDRVIIMREDGE